MSKNTQLTHLHCYSNQLSTLDLSKNTQLTIFYCYRNQLSTLDLSHNTKLTGLWCYNNKLSTLGVSKNTQLTKLSCGYNQLNSLEVSQNTQLTELECSFNKLSTLDVSQNTQLTTLDCGGNQLSTLDLSKNTQLTRLECLKNQLRTLDMSHNAQLTSLKCHKNQLSMLDVSHNAQLTRLWCYDNQLSTLDVSKDTQLTELWCYSNQLSTLDVSQNTKLTGLACSSNQLNKLDVSQNTKLTYLYCEFNQLNKLDVSQNTKLTGLACSGNQLSTLDVSRNTKLGKLWLYGNLFTTSALNAIYCQLPERSAATKRGYVYSAYKSGDVVDEILTKSSSGQIAKGKNWAIQYYQSDTDIEGIEGNFTCGASSKLTLEPATMALIPSYGKEWQVTITSTEDWKIDETISLPDWLEITPKQGVSGTKVTVKAKSNPTTDERKYALVFALANDATTKEVIILAQQPKPPLFVTPSEDYTFPAAGETKEDYFTVESTGAWKVTSSNAEWFPVETKEGGTGTTQVTIKADANNSATERSTILTFSLKDAPEVKQDVLVRQEAKPNAVEDAVFANVIISPNPFGNELRIKNNELRGEYALLNAQGVVVRSGNMADNEVLIESSDLTSGLYLLRLIAENGATKTITVVKDR